MRRERSSVEAEVAKRKQAFRKRAIAMTHSSKKNPPKTLEQAWDREYSKKENLWNSASKEKIEWRQGSKILELGCGNGQTLKQIAGSESGKKTKSRARVVLKKAKGKRIRDKPVFVTRDRARVNRLYLPHQTIKFEAF